MISKAQVDQLGDRLRRSSLTEADLELLDEYRRSFGGAYETVERVIQGQLGLEPTGRPAKSTGSIVAKLRRESIRLSQMQDIAGCRIVVANVSEQDRVVTLLGAAFSGADIVDRRASPSHGYRAVHVIVRVDGKPVEIQVRSLLQHRWAELSEKASDLVDPELKYGGGPRPVLERLTIDSQNVALYEECEERLTQIPQERHSEPEIRELHGALRFLRNALISSLDSTETMLAQVEGSGS